MSLIKPLFYFFIGSLCILHLSCARRSKELNWNSLIEKYSQRKEDSLKLKAAIFLKENMGDLTSEKIIFYSYKNGKEVDISLDTISSDSSLFKILRRYNIAYKTVTVADSTIVSNSLVESHIEKSLHDWKSYPWNKNTSWQQFLEYLLPYKIRDEYPNANWRQYFAGKYDSLLKQWLILYKKDMKTALVGNAPNDMYYRTFVEDAGMWFHYSNDAFRLSNAPGFSELLSIRKGECYVSSFLGVYILRSLGLPAAIDIVPHWGSKNGSHATEVFLDITGKMRTGSGRNLRRPAKVIRLSFKKQNGWKDSLASVVADHPFVLRFLQNNHWLDVTHEHTSTTTVTCQIPDSIQAPFAYICVYNYGEWCPVYYGKVNSYHQAIFYNMGCPMLYRVAIPSEKGATVIGNIFKVDEFGRKTYCSKTYFTLINMKLQKLNRGDLSWVKKDEQYSLYLWRNENHWEMFKTQICVKDSTINFTKVPSGGLYRLIRVNGNRRLERIFTYENGKQVWW